MPWYSYYPRQYGGLSLGALACGSTVACYDQLDPLRAWKLVGALALALAALAIHELRPFKVGSVGSHLCSLQGGMPGQAGWLRNGLGGMP